MDISFSHIFLPIQVANTPRPAGPERIQDSLAAALSDALKNRALAIQSESESSSGTDDEWD